MLRPKFLALLALGLLASSAQARVPGQIAYEGFLTDLNDRPANGFITVLVGLWLLYPLYRAAAWAMQRSRTKTPAAPAPAPAAFKGEQPAAARIMGSKA